MPLSYDTLHVGLSVVLAMLAAFTALELSARVTATKDASSRLVWLVCGTLSLAVGMWSMHFLGVLALKAPFEMSFAPMPMAGSGVLAIIAATGAFAFLTTERLPFTKVLGGSAFFTAATLGMHYQGLEALQVAPGFTYDWAWLAAAATVSLVAYLIAFSLAHRANAGKSPILLRATSALVLGTGLLVAHYVSMQALGFAANTVCTGSVTINQQALSISFALIGIGSLLVVLLLNQITTRFAQHESESNRLQRLNRELALKAHTDSLTGLPNREALELHVSNALSDARKHTKSFWVLFLDLDGFKSVNDTYGHLAGDELLKAVACRLVEAIRNTDKAFRVSGDEFVVVTGVADEDDQVETALAERILGSVREPYVLQNAEAKVTVSIGLSRYPDNGDDVRSLLLAADASMYASKKSGKNKASVSRDGFAIARSRPELVRHLERALERQELELVYQPIVTAHGRNMPGAEALLRWNHPTLGVLSPGQFIPQAEAFGLSNALGDWALENATRQIGANPFDEPTWVNVNLAAAQIQDHLLPKRIEELLSKYKVQPHQLGVEITESMSMVDTATSSKVLRALQDLGISISMDDFGTGYSSLAQLHRLPVDKLKVDKTFIDNMLSDSNAVRIVEAILAMSKALGLHTVAEGVETQAQFDRMKDLGVDKMQGFGISRPTSWAGLHQFALEWKQGRLVQMSDVPTLVD